MISNIQYSSTGPYHWEIKTYIPIFYGLILEICTKITNYFYEDVYELLSSSQIEYCRYIPIPYQNKYVYQKLSTNTIILNWMFKENIFKY